MVTWQETPLGHLTSDQCLWRWSAFALFWFQVSFCPNLWLKRAVKLNEFASDTQTKLTDKPSRIKTHKNINIIEKGIKNFFLQNHIFTIMRDLTASPHISVSKETPKRVETESWLIISISLICVVALVGSIRVVSWCWCRCWYCICMLIRVVCSSLEFVSHSYLFNSLQANFV